MKKTATLHDGRKIDYVHSDNPPKGGMKEVHFSTDGKFALCFYHDQSLKDDNRILRLESIIGNFDPTKTRTDGGASRDQKSADYYYNLFNWVKGIIVAPKFGVLTEKFGLTIFSKQEGLRGRTKKAHGLPSQS